MMTPGRAERRALGALSPNVSREIRSSPRLDKGRRNRLMGKILGDQSGRENSLSPKREGKLVIEPRPEELSANKELFRSPTKLSSSANTATKAKTPMSSGMSITAITADISPGREKELGRTQMKLLRGLESKKKAVGGSNIVSSQAKKTRDIMMKKEYEVKFPAGAMGLELEPVIISTERKVGCRVKDFYFGLGYAGIDPSILQKTIRVGDVISSIDGMSMLSAPFMDILEVLTSKRENPVRHLLFKDISSQWAPALASTSSKDSEDSQMALQSHSMDLIPPHTSTKSTGEGIVKTPMKLEAARLPLTPETSPATWKTYPATPDMLTLTPTSISPGATPTPTLARQSKPGQGGEGALGFALTVSPKAVKALSIASGAAPPLRGSSGTAAALSEEVSRADLGRVLGRVGSSISYGLKGVGQRILEPFADVEAKDRELSLMMSRKRQLLSELSQCCHLLGVAEEKESDLLTRLDEAKEAEIETKKALVLAEQQLREAKKEVCLLREEREQGQEEEDGQTLSNAQAQERLSALGAAVTELEGENSRLSEEVGGWQSVVEENKRAYTEAEQQLEAVRKELHSARQQIDIERAVRDQDREGWAQREEQTQLEQAEASQRVEQAMREALQRRDDAEEGRVKAEAEAEFLRETMESERASVHAELQRVKGQLADLQGTHRAELLAVLEERESAVASLKASERDLSEQLAALGVNLESVVAAKDAAEALAHQKTQSLEQLHSQLADSAEALNNAQRNERRLRQCYQVHQYHLHRRSAALDTALERKKLDWQDFEVAMEEKSVEAAALKQELLAASQHAVALEAQLRAARQDREDLIARFNDTSESSQESYRSVLQQAQREQDTLRRDKEELLVKVRALEDSVSQQATALLASKEEASALQARASSLEDSNHALQAATEEYKAKATAREEELCTALGRAEEGLKEGQSRLGMLRSEREQEQQAHRTALAESEAQLQSHESLWREEQERAALLEDTKRCLEDQLEAAQFAWETRNIDCQTLGDKLAAAEAEKEEAEKRLVEERLAHSRAHDEKEALLGASHAHKGQLSLQLDQERAKQRQCVQTASKACEELSWELRDVRNSVLDLGVLEGEYVNALKTVQSRYAGLVSSLEDKLREQGQEHAERVQGLQQRVSEVTRERDSLLAGMESKAADSDEKMAVTFARAREAEKLLEAAYDEHEELRRQVSVLNLQVSKGAAHTATLEGEVEFLKESAAQAKERHDEAVAFTEEQKFAVMTLRGEIARMAQRLEQADTDRATSEAQLSHLTEEHRISVEEVDALNELLAATKREFKRAKEEHQRKVDGMLEAQRDLVGEQRRMEEHHQATLTAHLSKAAQETERALEALGKEFEQKQQMLLEEHGSERENTREWAAQEAQKAREAVDSLQSLRSAHQGLKEDKRKAENMLMAQDEALSVSEGRVETLKEECELLEQARDVALAELQQLRAAVASVPALESSLAEKSAALEDALASADTFSQREAELVKQREDLMQTLKSQHSNLTLAVEEKDAALGAMRDEYSQVLAQVEVAVRAQKQAEADLEASQAESTALQARISRVTASNDSNLETSMASQDVVKKMATALSDSKALLRESVGENKTLLAQREATTSALREMREQLAMVQADRDAYRDKASSLEAIKSESNGSVAALQKQLQSSQREYEVKTSALEAQIRDLGQQVASAHAAGLSAQQQVAAKQAELDALHRQCTDLIAAAMASPEHTPTKGPRPSSSSYEDDHNENLDPAAASASHGAVSATTHNDRASGRQILREVGRGEDAHAHAHAHADADADTSAEILAISDLSSTDSHEPAAAAADITMAEAVQWHERLLSFALDMHEAITFATAEDFAAQEGIGETPKVSPPLRMASEALRNLHEHVLLAPWLDAAAVAPQSLPPAHEMLATLRLPEEHCHSHSAAGPDGGGNGYGDDHGDYKYRETVSVELARARETIDSLQQQLCEAVSVPPLQRQDSGGTLLTQASTATATVSQSEHLYSLMEDLEELLASKLELEGHGEECAAEEGNADTSMDSLQLGGEGSAWRNLHAQATAILTRYRVTVMRRAVSRSSSLDRWGSDASGSRTPSPRAAAISSASGSSPRGTTSHSLTALAGLPENQNIAPRGDIRASSSSSSTATSDDTHVRLSSESADMPRLTSSMESLSVSAPHGHSATGHPHKGRESLADASVGGLTLGELVTMTSQHASLDDSVDSLGSSGVPHAHHFIFRPLATAMPQKQEQEQEQEQDDPEDSGEVGRDDSGFWDVSAASIDPLSDAEASFEVAC